MALLRLLRPHQWSKNLLVFVSLLAGHQYGDWHIIADTGLTFLVFCLLASAGYVINDWLDMEDDRKHRDKRRRPLAAGEVTVPVALGCAVGLLLPGLALAWSINPWVFATAAAYLVSTLAYSFWLKRKLFIDIVMLAGLYTLRIIGGVAVVQVEPSFWLLAFAMFSFTGLASLKRYIELNDRPEALLRDYSVRAYTPGEMPILLTIGLCNGFLSVLVLAFYLDSEQVRSIYSNVAPLWLLCPLLMYWTGRIWLLASRSLVHADPVLFALRDRLSYVLAAGVLLLAWVAR